MEQNIKKIVILSVLFVVSVIFSRCQNDEYLSKTESTNLASAKTWFDDYKAKENFHPAFKNIEYHWEIASMVKLENDSEAIVVPMKDSPENPDYKGKKILYLYLADSGYEAVVHEIFSKSEDVSFFVNEKQDFQNLDSFNGYILTWNLKEGFVKGAEFENGLVVKNISSAIILSDDEKVKAYNQTRKAPAAAPIELDNVSVTGGTGGGGGCGGVIRFTPILGGGSIGGGTGGYISSPGSGTGGGSISAPTPAQIAKELQKKIDGTKLDPCPKAVLEKLKNATNCDIANILVKLGATTTIDLKILTEQSTDGKPAQTVRTNLLSRYQYTVRISPDYTSATSLFRASNILHEITHAYFMSLIDDYYSTGNPVVFVDTPTLFQAYCDKKFPPKQNELPNLHHAEMARTYVSAIASALQEFQTGIPVSNGTPNQVYTDLAWGGLRETPIYNEIFPEGSASAIRIKARYAAESNGGTSGNQTAIGKPCEI